MKILLRLCFVSLIVLGSASQCAAGRDGVAAADAQSRLSYGLERLDLHIDSATTDDVLRVRSPSCKAPIRLTLARIDGGNADTLAQLGSPNDDIRYIYLGSVEAKWSQTTILLRWLQTHVRFALGLISMDAPSQFVLLMLPKTCPDLAALPWSTLSPGS